MTIDPLAQLRGGKAHKTWQGMGKHTINGAYGEAEPTVLVTIQSEKNDQVCDRWQDDSGRAQTRPSHEEFTCDNRVTQTGNMAEG